MAVHNFNKTYTYVSAEYVDKSESDNTQIISKTRGHVKNYFWGVKS